MNEPTTETLTDTATVWSELHPDFDPALPLSIAAAHLLTARDEPTLIDIGMLSPLVDLDGDALRSDLLVRWTTLANGWRRHEPHWSCLLFPLGAWTPITQEMALTWIAALGDVGFFDLAPDVPTTAAALTTLHSALVDPSPVVLPDSQSLAALQEGSSVTLHQAGPGVRLLHACRSLRHRGLDPAEVAWDLYEPEPLRAAVLAANLALWDLPATLTTTDAKGPAHE